jgi:hypothetical protein
LAEESSGYHSKYSDYPPPADSNAKPLHTQETGNFEAVLDLVIVRPFALGATIATTGLFVGLSPLIGLATIIKPHDALRKTSQLLVIDPAKYTFVRPLGLFE